MFGTADVEIDRHPGPLNLGVNEPLVVVRIEKPQVIPAGTRPLRHRVGFAAIPDTVPLDKQPVSRGSREGRVGGVARAKIGQFWQRHREVFGGKWLDHASRLPVSVEFVEHRERLPPEPLPAEEPVAKLVIDGRSAQPGSLKIGPHLGDECVGRQPGVGPRRHRPPPASEDCSGSGVTLSGFDHPDDLQPKGGGKLMVPVIVGRNRHNRARAVRGEHVVSYPDGHLLASQRMQTVRTGEHPRLFVR